MRLKAGSSIHPSTWPIPACSHCSSICQKKKVGNLVLIEKCKNTQYITVCCIWGFHRPVRVAMVTPLHRRKHQKWAHEHLNLTTEQWAMETTRQSLQDLKDLLLMSWCRYHSPCLNASGLFWQQKGGQQTVRQVVYLAFNLN